MLDRTASTTLGDPPLARSFPVGTRTRDRRKAVARWALGIVAILLAGALSAALGAAVWLVLAAGLAALAGWCVVSDRSMRISGGIPVLVWHSVSRDAGWLPWAANISVSPETLDRQLAILRKMGCESMDSAEFARRRGAGRDIPANTVMLHFDDGYLDNWVAAAPILSRHGMRATIFVSLDFIAPDRPLPPTILDTQEPLKWDGYLSWAEIRALDQGAFGAVFGVEAHGVDHARVPTGPGVVDHLTRANWRPLAWLQWAAMPGDKHDWYTHADPPALGYGTEVPQSGGALAVPAWTGDALETTSAYAARVRSDLRACHAAFLRQLGRPPQIFCWPQNQTSALARTIAAEEGFVATTGGSGANRPGENGEVISRVHAGERVAGFYWPAADDLFLRATVHAFRGNSYWYLPILALSTLKRLHDRLPGKALRI